MAWICVRPQDFTFHVVASHVLRDETSKNPNFHFIFLSAFNCNEIWFILQFPCWTLHPASSNHSIFFLSISFTTSSNIFNGKKGERRDDDNVSSWMKSEFFALKKKTFSSTSEISYLFSLFDTLERNLLLFNLMKAKKQSFRSIQIFPQPTRPQTIRKKQKPSTNHRHPRASLRSSIKKKNQKISREQRTFLIHSAVEQGRERVRGTVNSCVSVNTRELKNIMKDHSDRTADEHFYPRRESMLRSTRMKNSRQSDSKWTHTSCGFRERHIYLLFLALGETSKTSQSAKSQRKMFQVSSSCFSFEKGLYLVHK